MKKYFLFSLGLWACLCLSGCGTYYRVAVDSLNAEPAASGQYTYHLKPGNEDVGEDDLLFRDIARMLAPAFAAQGLAVVMPGTDTEVATPKKPRIEAHIAYWKEEPRTTLQQETVTRSHPVRVRDGKHKERIEYVYVDEEVVTARTDYGASLLVTAVAVTPKGETRQLWRTAVTCTGPMDGFRTLVQAMIPALEISLGTQTRGERFFEVFVDDNGKMSLSER